MYRVVFVICLCLTSLCHGWHQGGVSTSGNGALPDCSSKEEEIFYKCGAIDLKDLEMQYSYIAAVMGYAIYKWDPQFQLVLSDGRYAQINKPTTPQEACTMFDRYNYCVKNFYVREKCVSQLDGFITLFWNYSCDPRAGYNDLSRSGECLANADLMDAFEKQLIMPKCMLSVGEYYNVAGHMLRNVSLPVVTAWCALINISTNCFEPAFEKVCGKEAGNFISGLFSRIGELIKERIGPSIWIRCNEHSQQMSNHELLDDPKNRMNPKSEKHGDNQREIINDYLAQITEYSLAEASIGDSIRTKDATWFGILKNLIQTDRGLSPVMSSGHALMSHLASKLIDDEVKDFIQYLKKTEVYIATRLGSCSALAQLISFLTCLLEAIESRSGQVPSIFDMEKLIIDYCSSQHPERLHKCVVQQLSPCVKGYVHYLDDNINATCMAHLAVNQDNVKGCFWPSISGLEVKSMCNISTTELMELTSELLITDNWDFKFDVAKRVVPLIICADNVMGQLIVSRLSSGCSNVTRAKVKDMFIKGEQLVDYHLYDFFVEYVHDIEILKNSTELGNKAPYQKLLG